MEDALTLEALSAKREEDLLARERIEAAVVLVGLRGGEPEWLTIRKARERVPHSESGVVDRQCVAAWCALIYEVAGVVLGDAPERFTIQGQHLDDSRWRLSRVPHLKRSEARRLSDGIRAALPNLFRACNITIDWRGSI